jgi:hypothetical protein
MLFIARARCVVAVALEVLPQLIKSFARVLEVLPKLTVQCVRRS